MITELDSRAKDILTRVVVSYLEDGEPMGSRTLSKSLGNLSPATIRNVMADLQDLGLLYSPHTSAGRLPTELALRFYVDAIMGDGLLDSNDRNLLEQECLAKGQTVQSVFERTSRVLSGLSSCAGLVVAPKRDELPIRHIDFILMEKTKALAILVLEDGSIENRLMDIPPEITGSELQRAGNFLRDKMCGKTLRDMQDIIQQSLISNRRELDVLTAKVVEAGLALKPKGQSDILLVQGTANILQAGAMQDLEAIQRLFDMLEKQETAEALLKRVSNAEGVQIFIGTENQVFQDSGTSLIISPYFDEKRRIVGAIGVIGPTRINYRRVIPMVEYSAKLISQMMSSHP